jgi:hypothetical protein
MKANVIRFGEIELEGHSYTHDLIVDGGNIRKRNKKNSNPYQTVKRPIATRASLPRKHLICRNRIDETALERFLKEKGPVRGKPALS